MNSWLEKEIFDIGTQAHAKKNAKMHDTSMLVKFLFVLCPLLFFAIFSYDWRIFSFIWK